MCYLTGKESCLFWRYSWLCIENLRDVSQVEMPKDASKTQILRGGHRSFLINSVVSGHTISSIKSQLPHKKILHGQ